MLYVWTIAIIIFCIIEFSTPQLVSIWFAGASVIALFAAMFGAPVWLQVTLFLSSSIVLVIITRPLYKKYLAVRHVPTNVDMLIGETAIVLTDIDNDKSVGEVKVRGQVWSARSQSGERIKSGRKVIVTEIKGVKLIVKPHSAE